jgi:hypothetical protein
MRDPSATFGFRLAAKTVGRVADPPERALCVTCKLNASGGVSDPAYREGCSLAEQSPFVHHRRMNKLFRTRSLILMAVALSISAQAGGATPLLPPEITAEFKNA